eukprot:123794-Chlamydomonas_euryale.AAC.1
MCPCRPHQHETHLFRQNQVPERHRQHALACQPPVRHHAHKVLRRYRLRDGHRERERMLLVRVAATQHPVLVIEDHLAVLVLNYHPEGLHATVDLERTAGRGAVSAGWCEIALAWVRCEVAHTWVRCEVAHAWV